MLWDGLIVLVASVLAINGWNRGLVASWRGPVAIIAATLIVQQFYIDFSTWLVSRIRINPEAAVVAGYLLLWFCADIILEIILYMFIKQGSKARPVFLDRLGGVAYGLVKACIIALLPLMVSSVELKIPPPPADKSGLVFPQSMATEGSYLLPGLRGVAMACLPHLQKYVVSSKPPSFTPVYELPEINADEAQGRQHTRQEIEELLK
ncbi:MAG: CvpA family protein [Candidatus Melainabacteria bacterium]|nr:CvpA family protein [Candidatus Melainabacteria bacterium]